MNLILEGIVGSTAYGLATETSDVDKLGVFVGHTLEIAGLRPPKPTRSGTKPDYAHHEVGKFMSLALKGNPTVLELLYLNDYTVSTDHGRQLVGIRSAFLSTTTIRNAYGGYATSQIRDLERRGDFGSNMKKRYSKHAHHCFRLLIQGEQLLTTGTMSIKVSPDQRELLFALGNLPPEELIPRFNSRIQHFNELVSVLPDKPDTQRVHDLLSDIRRHNL